MQHVKQTFSTRRGLSAACFIVFVSACRFSSTPTEELGSDAADSVNTAEQGDAGAQPSAQAAAAAAPSMPAAESSSAAAAESGSATATPTMTAASSASMVAPVSAHGPPPTVSMPAAGSGGSASTAPSDLDAGAATGGPDQTGQSLSDSECSAELAGCLLKDPLNYAECLRINADHGCPEPDAGTSTTSPVTTEDGKPLSQACQAELANCIMRNPTPENANACTEKARKCK